MSFFLQYTLSFRNFYVLLQPKTPCMYQGAKENYEDDWFFFNMTEEDKTELLERGIVFDSPVFLGSTEEISSLMVWNVSDFTACKIVFMERIIPGVIAAAYSAAIVVLCCVVFTAVANISDNSFISFIPTAFFHSSISKSGLFGSVFGLYSGLSGV